MKTLDPISAALWGLCVGAVAALAAMAAGTLSTL